MAFDQATLPRDPDQLIEIIVDLQDRNSHLLAVVATLRRAVFGPRSEKLLVVDRAQLRLELNDVSDGPQHRRITEAPAAL